MGRPAKYGAEQILDATRSLVVDSGAHRLSVPRVAESLGAPVASIYHRFGSRDLLAGSLWLRAVTRFQEGLLASLAVDDPVEGAVAGARYVVEWSREHLDDARLLLLYRSSDLLRGSWPAPLRSRNRRLRRQLDGSVDSLVQRLGATEPVDRRRVLFAVHDIPYGAVRRPLGRGTAPEAGLEDLVEDAVRAVLARYTAGVPRG